MHDKISIMNFVFGFFNCIATCILAFVALNAFKGYRKQQRSEAASKLLALIKCSINDLEIIMQSPHLYQYSHIDENHIYSFEVSDEKPEPILERPSRIVYNIGARLRKDSYGLLAQIGGAEAKRLQLLMEQQKYFIRLGHLLYEKLKDGNCKNNEDIEKKFLSSSVELKNLLNKANEILQSIIDN